MGCRVCFEELQSTTTGKRQGRPLKQQLAHNSVGQEVKRGGRLCSCEGFLWCSHAQCGLSCRLHGADFPACFALCSSTHNSACRIIPLHPPPLECVLCYDNESQVTFELGVLHFSTPPSALMNPTRLWLFFSPLDKAEN